MSSKTPSSSSERRSFLARFNLGAASLAALAIGGIAKAQEKAAPAGDWQPARHDLDDWMEAPAAKHRLLFDTTTQAGFSDALRFAGNYLAVNRDDYGLENGDLSLIIVARHMSTAFAYTDAMWAKYGQPLAGRENVIDPKTKEAPIVNLYTRSIASLAGQGVRFAVCSMATQGISGMVASAVAADSGAINQELIGNLTPNARMVPAGIVAVSRAQERGYTLVSA